MKLLDQFSYSELKPVLSTEGMRALDKAAKEALAGGASAIEAGYGLMKQAGAALFKKVVEILDNEPANRKAGNAPRSVAVFVGGGNNGGDGLVLAKLLIEAGIPCTTYSLAAADKFQNEAKMALDDFSLAGGRLTMYSPTAESLSQAGTAPRTPRFADFNLIVDCTPLPVTTPRRTGVGNPAHTRLKP